MARFESEPVLWDQVTLGFVLVFGELLTASNEIVEAANGSLEKKIKQTPKNIAIL
jgi:hypothetical protein